MVFPHPRGAPLSSTPPRRGRAGFTTPELLITLSVLAVLAGIAFPRFRDVRRRLTLEQNAQQLARDLRRAQVEAERRNRTVEVIRTGEASYTVEFLGARGFEAGITFDATSPDTVRFAPFGPPSTGAAAYRLRLDGDFRRVALSAAGVAEVR